LQEAANAPRRMGLQRSQKRVLARPMPFAQFGQGQMTRRLRRLNDR
jgi:hypothetical protein